MWKGMRVAVKVSSKNIDMLLANAKTMEIRPMLPPKKYINNCVHLMDLGTRTVKSKGALSEVKRIPTDNFMDFADARARALDDLKRLGYDAKPVVYG